MSGKHTDIPWACEYIGDKAPGHFASDKATIGFVGDYRIICADEHRYDGHAEDADDAAFIVEAVNSYDSNRATIEALVGQLTGARTMLEGYAEHDDEIGHYNDAHYTRQRIAEIDAALRLARGGA